MHASEAPCWISKMAMAVTEVGAVHASPALVWVMSGVAAVRPGSVADGPPEHTWVDRRVEHADGAEHVRSRDRDMQMSAKSVTITLTIVPTRGLICHPGSATNLHSVGTAAHSTGGEGHGEAYDEGFNTALPLLKASPY